LKLLRATQKLKTKTTEDMIVFIVHGSRFAIAASAVDEIRNLDGLLPHESGGRASKARFTLIRQDNDREHNAPANGARRNVGNPARGDDVYFVVEASAHFHVPVSKSSRVLLLRDCSTAVLVDGIERMMQVSAIIPLPKAFSGEEQMWYRGLTVVDEQVIPVINPGAFLSKAEVATLQSSFKAGRTKTKGAASA
jgi:chemotaxis signal transduction protein